MAYDAPGFADSVSAAVLAAWNTEIQKTFDGLRQRQPGSLPFFLDQPSLGGAPVDAVKWPADPAEPRFCIDASWAQKLSDWGVKGRHLFHNEYCEYAMTLGVDAAGKARPKRFSATTELPEWWMTVATHDPAKLRDMAKEVLGTAPAYTDLYGPGVTDPAKLSATQRRIRFAIYVAGHGQHTDLIQAKVPREPIGDLNTKNALFMSHYINGLDDLVYIVMFGAHPYAVKTAGGGFRLAELREIFREADAEVLACRNADPAAAQGAYDAVMKSLSADGKTAKGSQIALANPIGMYVRSFKSAGLTWKDKPVPASWIKLWRGKKGFEQRLEFGPPEGEEGFLDEIMVEEGAEKKPLTGGYQLAGRIEVGPKLLLGPERDFAPALEVIAEDLAEIKCSASKACKEIAQAREEYEKEHAGKTPRGSG